MVGTTTADMRASFGAGISLPLAKRREQLQALQRLFTENEDSITEALKQDLSRPLVEAQYYDVLLPLSEIAKLCVPRIEKGDTHAPLDIA
eukprot:1461875-Pyramimonas_sp.AAC.1